MRKQTQFNGLWQSTATGVIRYADTDHGVLWERTLEDTREVWRQLPLSKSHLRGYLQAQSEAGWQMVSSNRDAAREPEAYEAWHGDMFPHGVPLRVSEYACDVKHTVVSACESDAAAGWTVDMRGAVLDDVGHVVKRKKVAYASRHKGMVHVVRRDRYERAGRDATVEAEITAFVAKLRKAA